MTRLVLFAVGLALCAALSPARASDPDCAPAVPAREAKVEKARELLELLSLSSSCLGSSKHDPESVTTKVHKAIAEVVQNKRAEALGLALDALLVEADLAIQDGSEPALWAGIRHELQRSRDAAKGLDGVVPSAHSARTANQIFPAKWAAAIEGQPVALGNATFALLSDPACESGKPCPVFHSRVRAIRVSVLMSMLAKTAQRPELARLLDESTLALNRWRAYREKAHPQYVWELAVNSALMGEDLCATDGKGLRLGFCKAPNSQLIVLHPSAALRLSRSATKSSELRPAALVQLIGWYGWSWATVDGRPTATVNRPLGLSLAATYTRSDHEKRWAFGPMVHYGTASLALTKAGGGGRWSVVVNVQLADKYFSTRDRAVEELSKLKKRSAMELLFD